MKVNKHSDNWTAQECSEVVEGLNSEVVEGLDIGNMLVKSDSTNKELSDLKSLLVPSASGLAALLVLCWLRRWHHQ